MFVTSKRTKHLHNLPTSITIENAQIPFKQSVKNLGFTLDCHLTMNAHVSNIAQTCYFELRRLASIRRFLTSTATATLVSDLVSSRIDYCNSLLFGSTHDVTSHLQRTQNYAGRVILHLPMLSSITTHFKSLHWLPIKVRSTYKIALPAKRHTSDFTLSGRSFMLTTNKSIQENLEHIDHVVGMCYELFGGIAFKNHALNK